MSVKGSVETDDGRAVRQGAGLSGTSWLTLSEGAILSVKHVKSAREVTLEGPARVLPCRRGGEQFLVASGVVRSVRGTGVRPGAEVVIATPVATLSYGDARMSLDVGESELALRVSSGVVTLATADGSERAPVGSPVRRAIPTQNVKGLVDRCREASDAAVERARAVLDRRADRETLGKRAADQVLARHAARNACGTAAAAVGRLKKGTEATNLGKAILVAEEHLRQVPSAPQGTKK